MKILKKVIILASPLLLFAVLVEPYNIVNQKFIVKWLGCGCPEIDEFGNIIRSSFNANDFTSVFWLFISVCATVAAVFISKKILKYRVWFRVIYIIGVATTSLFISYQLYQAMMWL